MTERSKKGSKIAGSSRIAELGSGGPSTLAFGAGFGSRATPTSMTSLLPEDFDHLDSELKVLLKRLSKKDAQTKIKATDDLKAYFISADDNALLELVYIWPKLFNKMALDVERKIRENMISCHGILFTRLKKDMAPVLKSVIGTWLCLQFDSSSTEITKQAIESFQTAFPNKRADVLTFCQAEIQTFVNDNILFHTVESMSDARYNTPEEMLAKYIRVVSGSFSIISCLYENIVKLDALNTVFETLLDTPKFWETAKSPHAPIRRSVYSTIKTLALLDATVSPLTNRLQFIKSCFLDECFADKDPMTHDALWDAVLSLTRSFPQIWIDQMDPITPDPALHVVASMSKRFPEIWTVKKRAFSRLFKYLENGCYGSGLGSWPALLALLAHLPKEFFESSDNSAPGFRERFFDAFWLGVSSTHVTPVNSKVFVKSIQECSLFLFLKYGDSMFASKETGFQKVAPPTLNRLFEALLFPSLNADAQFKLSKEDLLAAVAGFLLKVCSTTTVSTVYSDALSGAMCHDISTVFSTGIRFRLDGTPLSIDEYIVFCGRSAELLEYFSSLDIKSPSLKSKLSDLTETLILGSIEKMKAQNEYTKAAIQMFAGLITSNVIISTSVIQALNSFINESMENLITSEPEAIRLIGAILKLSLSAQQEFHLLLLRKIVASKNLDALKEYTTKSLTCSIPRVSLPDLDELVIELFKNKSVQGRDLVIQSLVAKDGVAGVSQGAVNIVSELIHGSIEDFLAACLSGAEQNEDRVLFALRLMEDLSRSSVASLWALPNMSLILCDVLQIASFKFIIDNHVDVSDLALSLWKHGTSWSAGHSSLLNVGVTKWRSQLLDDEYPATSSDFILFYQRLKDMCSNDPSLLSHLCQSLLLREEDWTTLTASFMISYPSLAIIDPSYIISANQNPNPPKVTVEESNFSRVSSTLAGVLDTSISCGDALELRNVFQLVLFKHMLSSSRDAVGVLRDLNDSLSQIDAVVLDLVRREENLNSWTSDVMGKVKNGSKGQKGLLVHSLQIAIDSGFNAFYGRVFAEIARVAVEEMSPSWRRGVLGLVKTLFDAGFFHIAVPLCFVSRKYLDPSSADTFIPILCRSASLSKTDLSNTASVERGTAALSIITSILFTCQDISSESFALPVKNLVKQFRVWFMAGNDVRLGDISAVLVAQVADFLSAVIERGAEFDINVASFVVELANTMILNAPTKTVLFRALAMYQAITSGDLETWAAMDKFHDSIQEVCLDLFISECSGENLIRASRPQSELQSRLAYICGEMDFRLLFKRLPLDELARILFTNNSEAQIMSYRLLIKLTHKLVETMSIKLEMSVRTDEDEKSSERYIGEGLVEGISKDVLFIEPEHLLQSKLDLHFVFGILLSWMAVLDHFTGATYELRSNIVSEIKDLDVLPKLLDFIFFALGVGYSTKPFDLTGWEFSALEMEGLDFESEIGISLLCSHLYYRILRNMPALARSWWSSCKDRQLTLAAEGYTDKWFTPLLVQAEIDLVLTTGKSSFEDMELKASKQSGEITATYLMDEASADIVVKFPSAFPLKPVEYTSISGGKAIGVPENKWRSWMLSASIIAQNTAILDSLGLWQKNIKLHFEGIEECAICYSVVGVIDRSLPSRTCRTCKNKFHAACLFKWIRTSGNTQCPMCRSEL